MGWQSGTPLPRLTKKQVCEKFSLEEERVDKLGHQSLFRLRYPDRDDYLYYDTIIVRHHHWDDSQNKEEFVHLRTGGFLTMTTKTYINEILHTLEFPAYIDSERGIWYVNVRLSDKPRWEGKEGVDYLHHLFREDITVYRDGRIVALIPEDDTKNINDPALAKKVVKYIRGFRKLEKLPQYDDSMGDCIFCRYTVTESPSDPSAVGKPMGDKQPDHLIQHIDEKYYMWSLIYNALVWCGHDPERNWPVFAWVFESGPQSNWRKRAARCLQKYLRAKIGLAT